MAFVTEEVRLAPSGKVYVAAVGSPEPVGVVDVMDPTWAELGYITEDGVSLTPSVDTNDIRVWQSLQAIKTPITGVEFEVNFVPAQFNQDTLSLYFLGNQWENSGGVARLEVSNSPGTQERSLCVEWEDDEGDLNRLVVPRAQITDREALNLQRSELLGLGVTFRALTGPDGYTAVLLSSNADLIPAT